MIIYSKGENKENLKNLIEKKTTETNFWTIIIIIY
jgi:hypothetical protein